MSARSYRCTITSPQGTVLDVSRFLEIGGMGSINLAPEADLSAMTHGDFSMDLDNSTGEIEEFFEGAQPSDLYEVVLSRQNPDSGGWDRMFGGVLDLPYSLSYDDMAKTAHVVAFSFSKQLERTPADTIKRTLAYKTASITSGTSTLAFIAGETADLEVGDIVRVTNTSGQSDDFTIDRIISTTQVATVESAGRTYASNFAQVVTPFHRNQTPTAILTLVTAAAGVELNDLNLGNSLSSFPIATPVSLSGLNLSGVPSSLMPVSGIVTATFNSAYGTKRKTASGPTAAWADGATSNRAQIDWTPYASVEPTILDSWDSARVFPDTGLYAPQHPNSRVFWSESIATTMHLFSYSVAEGVVDRGLAMSAGAPSATTVAVEHQPVYDKIFFSHRSPGLREFRYWKLGAMTTVSTAISGQLRNVQYGTDGVIILVDDETNDLVFYNGDVGAGGSSVLTIPWGYPDDNILAWTMRIWGVGAVAPGKLWFTFLFERQGQTFVAVFDARGGPGDWRFVTTYRISSVLSSRTTAYPQDQVFRATAFQTIVTVGGKQIAVGYAAGQWFVLATHYAGVVPYADFEDSSCAKAARDIAVILGATVDIDRFKILSIVNLKSIGGGDPVADLGTPLSSMRSPVSELYRSSVQVSGTDESGAAIREIQGDQGDSARRATVESDLITTPGMALACAIVTLAFVSQIREQRNVAVMDDGTILSVFDRVTMQGKDWVIYKISTDLEMQTHELTLLELVP